MTDLVLITPSAGEPVSVDDVLRDLGYGDSTTLDDATYQILSGRLQPLIVAARIQCEGYLRGAMLTQVWLMKLDGFPGQPGRYQHHGYPQILLPKPPFQRINSFRYVDTGGTLQTLDVDLTYGADANASQYGYQLDPGSPTQPARLSPPFARPWPPIRRVPSNVLIEFVCGFGGPVTIGMTANSTAVTGATFDPAEIGRKLTVPGAGTAGATLNTTIVTVDDSGNATAANAAVTTVGAAAAYLGDPVPGDIIMAVRFLAQFYYEQGGSVDAPIPRIVASMLDQSVNRIS